VLVGKDYFDQIGNKGSHDKLLGRRNGYRDQDRAGSSFSLRSPLTHPCRTLWSPPSGVSCTGQQLAGIPFDAHSARWIPVLISKAQPAKNLGPYLLFWRICPLLLSAFFKISSRAGQSLTCFIVARWQCIDTDTSANESKLHWSYLHLLPLARTGRSTG
jgi:hypothetical protein